MWEEKRLNDRMIHTFATREEAAVFATAMRADGYIADILDEDMASIYGPLAIGGVRVLVSDQPLEEEVNVDMEATAYTGSPPPEENKDGELLRTLRLFAVGVVGIGLLTLVITLLSVFANDPGGLARVLWQMLKVPLAIGLAFAIMGPWMIHFTRWLRGERVSTGGGILRWLLLALLVPLIILMLL
jgi:hypothetical protein